MKKNSKCKNEVITGKELQKHILQAFKVIESQASNASLFRLNDGSYQPSFMFSPEIIPCVGILGSQISDILKSTLSRAEKIGPGSSLIILEYTRKLFQILNNCDSVLQQNELIKQNLQILNDLPRLSEPATKNKISNLLYDLVPSAAELILNAIDIAGSDFHIVTEASLNLKSIIKLDVGYSFYLEPDPYFYAKNQWRAIDVACLVVDGIIENVSEIDNLLQACYEKKQALALFTRGFSHDVINTLRVNDTRGTLKVLPVCVPFDIKTANILNDLAVVFGCDVISSLKGELISTKCLADLSRADEILCNSSLVSILNSRTQNAVNRHITSLREKRVNVQIPIEERILDARIKTLSSSTVTISIGNDDAIKQTKLMQELDLGLRLVHASLRYGIIEKDKLLIHHKCMIESLQKSIYPTLTLGVCIKLGSSLTKSLLSIAAAVVSVS